MKHTPWDSGRREAKQRETSTPLHVIMASKPTALSALSFACNQPFLISCQQHGAQFHWQHLPRYIGIKPNAGLIIDASVISTAGKYYLGPGKEASMCLIQCHHPKHCPSPPLTLINVQMNFLQWCQGLQQFWIELSSSRSRILLHGGLGHCCCLHLVWVHSVMEEGREMTELKGELRPIHTTK